MSQTSSVPSTGEHFATCYFVAPTRSGSEVSEAAGDERKQSSGSRRLKPPLAAVKTLLPPTKIPARQKMSMSKATWKRGAAGAEGGEKHFPSCK